MLHHFSEFVNCLKVKQFYFTFFNLITAGIYLIYRYFKYGL